MSRVRSVSARLAAVGVLGALMLVLALSTAQARPLALATPSAATASAHKCLVMTGSGDPAFVRNFNPYTATSLPSGSFVRGAFYEPLIVTTLGGRSQVPWLASSWKWSQGGRTLTLTIRNGVKWSDGQPLTAADVVYSLTAGKQDKVMDMVGAYRAGSNIASIKQSGSNKVVISLKTPDSQFIVANLNLQFVVPKHVFSKVKKVSTWTNPNPVGSGPFTQLARFTTQDYVLNKNPNYWKSGAPKIPCVEYVQATSNDSALLLIQSGKVDWTHNFVPNVEKAYEAKDKAHYHSFYATTAYPIGLMLDTTKYPFSQVELRKAISMSINRNDVSKLGEYGYAPPADAVGLNGLFPSWVTNPAVKAEAKQLATYNPNAAKKLLTDSGFKYDGSSLVDPKGDKVAFDIHVISGWSDWVASLQIITKNLKAIGIDSNVKLEPDWNSWYPNAASTKTPTLLWQTASAGSPYGFFYSMMHDNAYVASGQDGTNSGNWIHYKNTAATQLLDKWKITLAEPAQKRIANQLAALWLKELPMVPLFIGPRWSTYSTKYFHCFASPSNFYGDPIFTTAPDNILSFTQICPGGKAGA
jgi:peptide/nickel transport system substrate-binding protein